MYGYSNLNIPNYFWIFRIFWIFNSVTLGDALGHLNILKDIQIFKFEFEFEFFWIFGIFWIFNSVTLGDALGNLNILKDIQIFKFEYPQIFLDIQNFLDIQLCDIGRCPRTLEYPKVQICTQDSYP